jgi:hypothetical protein
MGNGHVDGLPEAMFICADEKRKKWQLYFLLEGPDEPETLALEDSSLDDLIGRAERLITFHEVLLPALGSPQRELEIRALQEEHDGQSRPKALPVIGMQRHPAWRHVRAGVCPVCKAKPDEPCDAGLHS